MISYRMLPFDDDYLSIKKDLRIIPLALHGLYAKQFQEVYFVREAYSKNLLDYCIKCAKYEKEYEMEVPFFWYNRESFQFTTKN